jgi:4-hydroxy-tetrahydrodipicolinate reductase
VAALLVAVRAVKSVLAGFDVEIVEAHHSGKKDAPSGTAIRILEALRAAEAVEPEIIHGRNGIQPRQTGEIGVHAVRGGSNPGRHEVHFQGRAEDLVLTHQAYSREVFAAGALRAVRFVVNAPPGLYGMDDLLGSEGGLRRKV